jgi:hypothetical protein
MVVKPQVATKAKGRVPVKAAKKAGKPARRQAGPNEVAVGVRWFYTKDFAKALGRDGNGKGRARRIDVKVWAAKVLDEALDALMNERG